MKTLMYGFIILLIFILILSPIQTILHDLLLPGSLWTDNVLFQALTGLALVYCIGKFLPALLRSLWFREFWSDNGHRIPFLARLIISIIPKDIDKANLMKMPEVEWDAEGEGMRRVGVLIGPLPDRPEFSRVLELPAGIPYGGTFRTIRQNALIHTGRTGEQLIAELISLGLNRSRHP